MHRLMKPFFRIAFIEGTWLQRSTSVNSLKKTLWYTLLNLVMGKRRGWTGSVTPNAVTQTQ